MRHIDRNERLARVLREAGFSHKALARAVRELSALHGRPVSCDHTSVSRWLAGARPRADTARLVAEALTRRLGRTVTLAEIGLPTHGAVDSRLGLTHDGALADCVMTLNRLLECDISEAESVTGSLPEAGAWPETALSWLMRRKSGSTMGGSAGRRVGLPEVEALLTTVTMFAELDNRFGGAYARRSLIYYLSTEVGDLLNGAYSGKVGRKLFSAAAESVLLAAWMSYDSGVHGLAQRYFVQALRLAQAGEDPLLAGAILDAMSHQATFLGYHRQAVNLARAARTGTGADATATQTAHFHAMEARALAAGGDSIGTQRALNEAVRSFERRIPMADPAWIRYFDEAELSAELSHCFHDIGRHADAISYATEGLTASTTGSARSDLFITMVQASGLIKMGHLEESISTLRDALEIGRTVRSARCITYLTRFRSCLVGHDKQLSELDDEYRDHPAWLAP